MGRQDSMPLALYGNLIWDNIRVVPFGPNEGAVHPCEKSYYRAGGVANFCRAAAEVGFSDIIVQSALGADNNGMACLRGIKDLFKTKIKYESKHPTSSAVIIVNPDRGHRTSFVQWGACSNHNKWQPIEEADWHHIMYLDTLKIDIDFIKSLKGTVSVDFSNNNKWTSYSEVLKHVDYVFIDNKTHYEAKIIPTRKCVINHTAKRTSTYYLEDNSKDISNDYHFDREAGLNVLGAGDYFSFYCIASILSSETIDVKKAHQQTLELLRKQTQDADYNPLTNSRSS